ncbi:transcriptional regulator [Cellvibrio zantedeschiae]|uniref:Transcriptional regulator n=1 Tax=Cellvibrio zantedeschiae TaxID=1237077 RepID=A0ABQ3AZ06_9GAMM|nr:LysR family transcriptional regulator [Cellvibrio zantedeschiae]GGY71134.1 transcriptional regulator [Cellvibrio zantedeschiae]
MARSYSLQDLELLIQVAERGNMSEVGRQLNMTTAAVSAAIKRLEVALDVSLFERTTRSLRLSAAGEAFIPHLQQILGTLDIAENELRNRQTLVAGEIRIGLPSDIGRHYLLALLNQFQELNPKVKFILHVSDLIQDLYRDELDIVIRYGQPKDSSLIAAKLCDNRRVLVASPDYLARHTPIKELQDLLEHNCLLFYLNGRPYSKWQFECEKDLVTLNVTGDRSANDGELVKRWAVEGKGVAYKSALDVAEELASGTLVEVLAGRFLGQPSPLYLLYKERKYQAYRMTALIKYLKERIS